MSSNKDSGEHPQLMEPLILSMDRPGVNGLVDLAFNLGVESAGLRSSFPSEHMVRALATLVRSMNCYYSNLIEGHNTHPVDIERALKGDYSNDEKKRNLQLEAKAHIEVQQWLDQGGLQGRPPASTEVIAEIHKRFCDLLPSDLLVVKDLQTNEELKVEPGKFRTQHVQIGAHVAVSPGAVPRFLERFSAAYSLLSKSETVLCVGAAHHRFLWIHPFLDGNGRVARLLSHAMLSNSMDTGALWSVARGLARREAKYKAGLMVCDETRKGDLDGRGNLSESALFDFTAFFLDTCIDQVKFMRELMQPGRLRARILGWCDRSQDKLPPRSRVLLEAILYRGEIPRGEVSTILDTVPRNARRHVAELIKLGVLSSASDRDPLTLAFPAHLAAEWMPGLFPEQLDL